MTCRGVRGATTVDRNAAEAILAATRELLTVMKQRNDFAIEEIGSIIFTTTADLDAVYPAVAARDLGWTATPLLCMQEMAVPGSLASCIRVLLHWNTDRDVDEIEHVYLRGARALRPDLVKEAS